MQDTAIVVDSLSKRYRIGLAQKNNQSFSQTVKEWLHLPVRRSPQFDLKGDNGDPEYIWAIKEISFEVQRGEVLGIIGRNGAGKSTLLKILSRITKPTTGRAMLFGRASSLLEVGTGFHQELTGRENIFLNGTIMGLKKQEINRRFDEIVAFSEIGKFIDTPVKRYSSGMQVRLAFAVAAHLEPEILITDEVLAVGDFAFQKKCLGKMSDIVGEGRTILFVSHSMEAVAHLCPRSILLEHGNMVMDGPSEQVIEHYLQRVASLRDTPLRERTDRSGDGVLRFVDTWIEDDRGRRVSTILSGKKISIVAAFEVMEGASVSNVSVAFGLYGGANDVKITDFSNSMTGQFFYGVLPSRGQFRCTIDRLPLNAGFYSYNLISRSGAGIQDYVLKAGAFDVEASDYFGSGKTVDPNQGLMLIDHQWNLD